METAYLPRQEKKSFFDEYWANFGKMQIPVEGGDFKQLSSLAEYLKYRNLPAELNNPKASKRKEKIK